MTNLREVTKDEFYAALKADPRDIMPSIVGSYERNGRGYTQEWQTQNSLRTLFGVTHSGHFPFTPEKYFLCNQERP
jgi:hypothetical protein